MLGEHTEFVCKEVLQMDDEEIAQLVMEGVLF
jgi:crotonobetainyl-CoA:carnitine CoA-transferase CaiB-like acyl-CoA transferase